MTTDKTRIEQQIKIDARPETVFSFLIDPAKMAMWMGQHIAVDVKPGGMHRVVIHDDVVAVGEYLEVTPPTRLVHTFGWESDDNPVAPGSTTVSYDLIPDGDGTLLTLTHIGLPDEMVEPHTMGWEHYMARLQTAASGGDPGPDPMAEQSEG
jgi:uncharacterized protein YndB with AHSA1/START domain